MTDAVDTKRCSRCGETKRAEVFYRDASRPDGLSRLCRPCTLVERAAYRDANREKLRQNAKRDREAEPLRGIWQAMIARCHNPDNASFGRYGARGIAVCERWKESFDTFREDMGARPSPAHSIDRIDGDGNYEPGNCRWATPIEQGRNRSVNRLITVGGRTQCVAAWGEERGLDPQLISQRINRLGWDEERAVLTPKLRKGSGQKRRRAA